MSISRERTEKLLADHIGLLKLANAPELDSEEFRNTITTWKEAFDELGFQPGELARASRRTVRSASSFWSDQLPAIIAAVEVERMTNPAQGPDAPSPTTDHEAALAASAGCEWCDGSGIVFVFHREYQGDPVVTVEQADGTNRRFLGRASKMCRCEYGRWMLGRTRKTDPHLADRLDGIDAVIDGRSRYVIDDPTRSSHPVVRYAPGRAGEALRPATAAR